MNDFVIIVTGLKSLVLDINVTIHCAGEVAFIIYIRIRLSGQARVYYNYILLVVYS